MTRYVPIAILLFGIQACSGGSIFNGLTGGGSTAPKLEKKPASRDTATNGLPELTTDNLEGELQLALEDIQSTHGDSEFEFKGYYFVNMETILTDALDLVQSTPIEFEVEGTGDLYSEDDIWDILSSYTQSYGRYAQANDDSGAALLGSSLKLQGDPSVAAQRIATLNDSMNKRFGDYSTADLAFARLSKTYPATAQGAYRYSPSYTSASPATTGRASTTAKPAASVQVDDTANQNGFVSTQPFYQSVSFFSADSWNW